MKVRRRKAAVPAAYGGWDLFKHGVSGSFVSKFLQCRMQCHLTYREGWKEGKETDYLDFGSAFHHLKEKAYQRKTLPKKGELVTWFNEFTADERKKRGGRLPAYWETMRPQVLVTAERYFAKYPEDFSKRTWIAAEEHVTTNFRLKVPGVNKFVDIPLHGTLDGVFTAGKELWIFDTKTKGQINGDELLDLMQWVFQFNLYIYIWWKKTGRLPTGFVLDVVRRPTIGQRTKRQPETEAQFSKRLAAKIDEDPDDYFLRIEERYSKIQIERWVKVQLEPILLDVYLWATGVTPTYTNPQGFYVRNSRTGLFQALVNDNFTTLKRKPFISLQDK